MACLADVRSHVSPGAGPVCDPAMAPCEREGSCCAPAAKRVALGAVGAMGLAMGPLPVAGPPWQTGMERSGS